jgi:glutamate racemase
VFICLHLWLIRIFFSLPLFPAQLPAQAVIYLGDQAHVPYGPRPLEEVRGFSAAVTRFLLAKGARGIVVACNAASAAALHSLRAAFPDVPFVGMEPAVKPAAEQTHTGVVGVLATPATFQGALYASVVERFAQGVTVLQHTCPGLVAQIESGDLDGAETRRILENALRPMLAKGIDTVVLGCTHYPAPAVARQAARLLSAHGWLAEGSKPVAPVFYTTGDPRALSKLLPRLLGETGRVRQAVWDTEDRNLSNGH